MKVAKFAASLPEGPVRVKTPYMLNGELLHQPYQAENKAQRQGHFAHLVMTVYTLLVCSDRKKQMKTAILYLIINAALWGGYPDTTPGKVSGYVMTITVTAYSPSIDETDSTPYITASNQRVRDGICALSRDIEKEFDLKFGDMIYLEGIGTCEFQDRMHKRMRKTVDLFMWWKRAAKRFGVIEQVRMAVERRG